MAVDDYLPGGLTERMIAEQAIADLLVRRRALAAEIAALDATKPGGRPNAKEGDYDHAEYLKRLYLELRSVDEAILELRGGGEEIVYGLV